MPSEDTLQFKEQQFARDALTRYRHNAYDLHLIGETIGPPTRVSSLVIGGAGSIGSSPYPAREDHVHGLPTIPDFTTGFNQTYTPVLTATTTNPTQGTGGTAGGVYAQWGKYVVGQAQWSFGSAGTAFGAGNYEFNLPVTPKAIPPNMTVSTTCYGWITSGGVVVTIIGRMVTSPKVRLVGAGTATTGATPTTPYVWANGAAIFLVFAYEAA
jgi:hypothetical protein